MLLLRRVAGSARSAAASAAARSYGTKLPIPQAPAGSEMVFHSLMQRPKYYLSNGKWWSIFFAMNLGAYAGNWFYMTFLMRTNPPNPPRVRGEEGPEKHMHDVSDE
eukprot:TRINITY_DN4247_c0_g4_i3.p3 TRINITY_DN4247_c0_g4~~TRINITY_DN4247_c0_g4_i3.p3  ORF type:complete len:106 (+),score=21.49 TRINITY_DN4247_c0_g4_i3:87-404(+)